MSKYPIIAREGWLPISLTVLLSAFVISRMGLNASLPLFLLSGLLVFLFRDPPRQTPSKPLAVISPVQGVVVSSDTLSDPWLDRQASRVRMKMGPLDIFALHSPVEGKVMKQWFIKPGREERQLPGIYQCAHWIKTDEGDDAVLIIRTRMFRTRTRCSLRAGERIGHGQRCGFILFGAEVEVLLAANSRVQAKIGDKVLAGSSILGELVHSADVQNNSHASVESSAT